MSDFNTVQYAFELSAENHEYEIQGGACVIRGDILAWCRKNCLTTVKLFAGAGDKGDAFLLSFENPRDAAFFKLNFPRPEEA